MRCTADERILSLIGQAMEYVLEMIMSPFWRELKWRECGGMGVSAVTGMMEGSSQGQGGSAAEPAPKMRNPEPEKIILVQNHTVN